ncbi:MAG: YfhO family protein, partial [Candidatus Binatia bacterium]
YEAIVHALFAEHRLPLWNPYEFCGLPLLGVAQASALYAPMWLAFGMLPPRAGLQAFYAFHLGVLGVGAAVYLRRHAVPGWAAAIVPAVSLAGLATGLTHSGYDHPNFLASVAWLPWMLVAVEGGARDGLRPWAGVLALLVAGQWLAGYPDFPMDAAVLLGVVALVAPGRSAPRALGVLAAGVAIGTALAALQLLPLADALAESPRNDAATPFGIARDLFAVASPAGLLRDLIARQGSAVLMLAVVGACAGGRVALAWTAALAWALFALNRPFVWLYAVPPFAGVRFPFGWGGLGPVFLAYLAARGVTVIAARAGPGGRVLGWALAATVVVESAAIVARVPARLPEHAPDLDRVAQRMRVLAPMMEGTKGQERIVSPSDGRAGAFLRYRVPSPAGWEPSLPPRRVVRLLQAAGLGGGGPREAWEWGRVAHRAQLLALLGIGTAVVPQRAGAVMGQAGFRLVGDVPLDDAVLHAVGVPRARLVHRIEVVADEDASFAGVLAAGPGAMRQVVLEAPGPVPAVADPPVDGAEQVTIARDEPEEVVINVTAASAGVLVLTDTYYRGWEATLDGAAVPILRADHAFRAVMVLRGTHRVEFRYRPRSVRLGAAVSGLALVCALMLLRAGRNAVS